MDRACGERFIKLSSRGSGPRWLSNFRAGSTPWDADQTGKFLRLAIQHPSARFILAHMGGVRFPEFALFGLVRRFAWYPRNVWCDLSAVATFYADSPYRDQLVWVIRAVGTDRVLFGSDWPHAEGLADPKSFVDDLHGFTDEEIHQIMRTNAEALSTPPA